jgi:hypothetical protein
MNTIRILNFEPSAYREEWERQGYLHVRNGVNPDFFAPMKERVLAEVNAPRSELADWRFAAKKTQHLFEFDASFDFPRGLYEDVAALTGADVERLTLCERHIKAYDGNANPNPVPHKDRLASEIVIGFPVQVPEDSYLILYPTAPRTENPYQSTAEWRELSSPNDDTEALLKHHEPVKLFARPGDIVVFQGAKIFHERVNPANSVLLFLKFNSMRMDPICEDLSTPYLEHRTAELLDALDDEQLMTERLEVSPRLEKVVAYHNRRDWRPVYLASLWKEKEIPLSNLDAEILKRADRGAQTGALLAQAMPDTEPGQICDAIRRLGRAKLIVLADKHPYQMSA